MCVCVCVCVCCPTCKKDDDGTTSGESESLSSSIESQTLPMQTAPTEKQHSEAQFAGPGVLCTTAGALCTTAVVKGSIHYGVE